VEAWSLVAIGLLYRRSTAQKFHEKWIAYRLLAELCRQQFVLSLAGRSIPVSACESTARQTREARGETRPEIRNRQIPDPECEELEKEARDAATDTQVEKEPPFESWVAWYFAAAQRAAPLPYGNVFKRNEKAFRIGKSLIAEQILYHRNRLERQRTAGRHMTSMARGFFEFTVLLVLAHLTIDALQLKVWAVVSPLITFCVRLFAALSAALLGVRAYAEFFLLERQSQMMLGALKEANENLDSIRPSDALASRDLGRVLFSLTLAMMEDIKGWSQLYGVKHIEPS
jgi:hypothetical protein